MRQRVTLCVLFWGVGGEVVVYWFLFFVLNKLVLLIFFVCFWYPKSVFSSSFLKPFQKNIVIILKFSLKYSVFTFP